MLHCFTCMAQVNGSSVVSYIRVSTDRQRRSGLGIEAQRATVARFAEAEGLTVIAEYIEAETGKGADALDRRPQLTAALARARLNKCPVLVSKLSLRPLVGSSFQRESSQTVLKEPIARDENSGCRFATCFTRPIRRLLRKIPIRPITLSQPTQ